MALGENGVDTLELGVPFSDPVADGPVIEAANQRALEAGFRFADLLEISEKIAPKIDTLWMGYFNPFYQYGMEALLDKAKAIGVSGHLVHEVKSGHTLNKPWVIVDPIGNEYLTAGRTFLDEQDLKPPPGGIQTGG